MHVVYRTYELSIESQTEQGSRHRQRSENPKIQNRERRPRRSSHESQTRTPRTSAATREPSHINITMHRQESRPSKRRRRDESPPRIRPPIARSQLLGSMQSRQPSLLDRRRSLPSLGVPPRYGLVGQRGGHAQGRAPWPDEICLCMCGVDRCGALPRAVGDGCWWGRVAVRRELEGALWGDDGRVVGAGGEDAGRSDGGRPWRDGVWSYGARGGGRRYTGVSDWDCGKH